ncbi:MAG: nicotinate (nicotinamide) nucleotide adenylyltransferase [Phycisphaerae bacterium]
MNNSQKSVPSPRLVLLYGGTFDPPHYGHITTALAARQELGADLLIYVPARRNPHKTHSPVAADAHRVTMLKLMLGTDPQTCISDFHLRAAGASYTSDLYDHIHATYPAAKIAILIGADQLGALPTWHRFADYCHKVIWAVLPRPGYTLENTTQATAKHTLRELDVKLLQTPPEIAVSSRELREKFSHNNFIIGPEISPAVVRYIQTHKLYVCT